LSKIAYCTHISCGSLKRDFSIINCNPEISVSSLVVDPIERISYPGGLEMDRNITTPESAGQCLYKYSTTFVATKSFTPDTNTFARGSTNHSFIRPLTAGGNLFAMTTSTFGPHKFIYVPGSLIQKVQFNYPFPKRVCDQMLIVTTSHFPCQ